MKRFAGVVIRNSINQILLVREIKPQCHGKYNLPGGHVEEGETAVECAVRETLEETGLSVRPQRLLGVYQFHAGEQAVFLAEHPDTSTPASGELACTWFTVDEAEQLPASTVLNSDKLQAVLHDLKSGKYYPLQADDFPASPK